MYKIVLIFGLTMLSAFASAQHPDTLSKEVILLLPPLKEFHFTMGVHWNQCGQFDSKVSPLIYRGWLPGAQVGLFRRRDQNLYIFNTHYLEGKIHNVLQPQQYKASLQHLYIQLSGLYRFPFYKLKNTRAFAGWQLSHQSDFRNNPQLQNSSTGYNVSSSIAPAFRIETWWFIKENQHRKLFRKERTLRFSYQLAIPFLAGLSRPPYNAIRKLHDGSGGWYKNSLVDEVMQQYELYTLYHFMAFYNTLEAQYIMKNGNRWALSYHWNYERLNVSDKVYQSGVASFQLSLFTKLNSR